MHKKLFALLALTVFASAAAVETARMQLPDGFRDQADFFNASGFRGRQKGDFDIGPYRGEFSRKDSRLDILDSKYVSNKARTSVVLVDPDTGESATASCLQKKGSMTLKIVTFDPKKLRYECELAIGDRTSQFMVGQAKGTMKQKFMALDLRSGIAVFPDRDLMVRSVHDYHGSKFTSQAPVGYLIEDGERTLAGVELTDTSPSVYLLRELEPGDRYRVMLIAMTISLLPAELE